MNDWLNFAAAVALYFLLLGAILAFFKGAASHRTAHEQLLDEIEQIEAVSRPGELS